MTNTFACTPTVSDLQPYLARPAPERNALLENWICEQLQDDGFVQLCQDMQGTWRRIGLGQF